MAKLQLILVFRPLPFDEGDAQQGGITSQIIDGSSRRDLVSMGEAIQETMRAQCVEVAFAVAEAGLVRPIVDGVEKNS